MVATFEFKGQVISFSVIAEHQSVLDELQGSLEKIAAILSGETGKLHLQFPVIVSMPFQDAGGYLQLVADMETCLAAAFFTSSKK